MRKTTLLIATFSITASVFSTMVLAGETTRISGVHRNAPAISYNMEGKERPGKEYDRISGKRHKEYLKMASSLLGVKEAELKARLEKGDNLYEILSEAEKVDEYKQIILQAKKEKLSRMVVKGKITEEEAKVKYSEFEIKITNWDGTPETEIFKLYR